MLELLTELLGYARKLLPLMELYTARKMAAPVRNAATEEFQSYTAEALRANHSDLLELRSAMEAMQQRLRVIDDQSALLERQTMRLIEQQRTIVLGVLIAAVASLGALILSIIILTRH